MGTKRHDGATIVHKEILKVSSFWQKSMVLLTLNFHVWLSLPFLWPSLIASRVNFLPTIRYMWLPIGLFFAARNMRSCCKHEQRVSRHGAETVIPMFLNAHSISHGAACQQQRPHPVLAVHGSASVDIGD
jgi:hypothetical protein